MIAWLSHDWTAVVSFVGDLNEGELRLLAGAASLVTVLVSVFAITRPLRYQKNAALLDQAIRALERAYNALTVDGTQKGPVPADRLNWLTAARNLETYKALKRKIGVKVHRRIADDHEEHWRHLFYLALQGNAYHQPTYYREPVAAPRGPAHRRDRTAFRRHRPRVREVARRSPGPGGARGLRSDLRRNGPAPGQRGAEVVPGRHREPHYPPL
jgi:hypothetical protein